MRHAPTTALAVCRRQHRCHVHVALPLVLHQQRQRVVLDAVADDEHVAAVLGRANEGRDEVLPAFDRGVGQEDVGVVELGVEAGAVGCEVGRDEPAFDADSAGDVEHGLGSARVVDGHHAFASDLLVRLSHQGTDLLVFAGDRRHLGEVGLGGGRHRSLAQRFCHPRARALDAPLQGDGVGAGGGVAFRLLEQRLDQHNRGGGAVSRLLVGLGGRFAHEPDAHLAAGVREHDAAGDGDPVVGDQDGGVGSGGV